MPDSRTALTKVAPAMAEHVSPHPSPHRDAMLFILSGRPGAGKSTLGKHLARTIGATYLRIDTIEQGLRDLCALDVEGEGYRLAYRIARDNLALGISVVADSCNPIDLTRREWEAVARSAGTTFLNIEIVCSDEREHRRRVEQRTSDVPGLQLPTWAEIRAGEFEHWHNARVRIDTAGKSVHDACAELLHAVWRRPLR